VSQEPSSRPSPSRGVFGSNARPFDALGSAQTVGALLAGILLFAVPLYLWRRPRSVPPPAHTDTATPDAATDAAPVALAPVDAGKPRHVKIADARVLECHDRGSRRTPPDQCDHIAAFEKAFADAVEASYECVPPAAGTGSIEFIADLSFSRKKHPVTLSLPRDGRSFQSPRIVKDCATGVRSRLGAFPVAPLTHAHARYKISFIASYGT